MPDVAALIADLTRLVAVSTRADTAVETCLRALSGAFGVRFAGLYRLDPNAESPLAFAGDLSPPTGLTLAGVAVAVGRVGDCVSLDPRGVETCLSGVRPSSTLTGLLAAVTADEAPVAALVLLADAAAPLAEGLHAAVQALVPVIGAAVHRSRSANPRVADRFVVALEHAGDSIEICNREAVIEWVNPAFEVMTGYTRAEAVGRTPASLFRGGQHPPEFYDAIDRVIRAGQTWRGRMMGRRRSGELYPQDCTFTPVMGANGELDCVIALRRDITDRIRAENEERHQRSNLIFRSLVEVLPDGIVVLREGRPVLANRAMAQLLGVDDPQGLVERGLDEWFHTAASDGFTDWLLAQERGDAPPEARTWHATDFAGQTMVLEIVPVPWPSYEGGVALLLVVRDVTERDRLQARVLMADRLSAMGMLLAGVGHEINNPLAYAQASLEILRLAVPPLLPEMPIDDDAREEIAGCLEDAWHGMRRIAATVADFRAFSRVRTERGRVDLSRLVELTTKMAQNEIRPRAKLVVDAEPIPAFDGEENRIAQVLLNLLINAAQAIPDGHADEHEIRLRIVARDGFVELAVSDTGAGIPPELQRRIFEPFFTTKANRGGSGLGLSICLAVARDIGGSLTLESTVGRGTTFTFRLPMLPLPTAVSMKVNTSPPPVAVGAIRRVLIIDDEPLVGRALERILPGDNVEVAVGGRAGLERLRRGGPWDAVLCDLVMPDCSGAEVYETIRAELPELAARFVFMTGGAFTPRLRAFMDEQATAVLSKPFDTNAVRDAVRRAAHA
jgi:PAS domain S-box-containing protein